MTTTAKTFTLDAMEVPASNPGLLKDIIKCYIHTIVHNRCLVGTTKHRKGQVDLLDRRYIRCEEAAKLIDPVVDGLVQSFAKERASKPTLTHFEITLVLKQKVDSGGWFNTTEDIPWETWLLPFAVTPNQSPFTEMADTLQDRLSKILDIVTSQRSHIPPMVSQSKPPTTESFNFAIFNSSAPKEPKGGIFNSLFAGAPAAGL